jgi:hypothetical protein
VNHFINTAASDLSRARTVGLNQLTPEPFPVLVVGTRSNHQFFFSNRGTLETWSGASDYGLRVTVGSVNTGPLAATFSLAIDGEADAVTVPFDVNQAGLQNILNDVATIGTTDGGVDVLSQGNGRFLIGYREFGIPSEITANGALLIPDCNAVLEILTTGSATARQLMSLTLTRTIPAQVTSWNTITSPYAGWSGVIPLDSAAAKELLWTNGVVRGEYLECGTLLTVEVIDNSGNAFAYFQAPITLRALNYMDTTTLPVGPTTNAQTNASGNTTVAPTSQLHTETLTISGGASVRNILVSSAGLVAGARIDLVLLFTGANGSQVKVYANTTGGALLFDFTRAGDEANALFTIYADGNGSFKDKLATIPAFG